MRRVSSGGVRPTPISDPPSRSRDLASLVEDWRPAASLERIRARADLLGRVRDFFAAAGVMEVETPILSRAAVTDPALASLRTSIEGPGGGRHLYLHTSPEFPMKRLVAAGSGPIYQICKVFRGGERGRRHHPEFSLLEWYRPGWDHWRLMDEVADLVRTILQRPHMSEERIGYRELFMRELDLDPWCADTETLRRAALDVGLADAGHLDLDRDGWLDLLLTHRLESGLGRGGMTFLHDYPPSQAALARIRPGEHPAGERFELYIEGIELANGFHELTDAEEQRRRFMADLEVRRELGLPEPPIDDAFLAALASGMPDCAGVALGLDRLLMIAVGGDHIDQVLTFPVERA
ncbi:EF-P lysine aminoacylase EpmA [Imhoffiella purpurea]|uniref:Translation elongation factor P Lys34:lysine transferase n=1 Tax=Imhoffiella purpurea TaxID=1249627 RepID=W9VY91_9GAMM|nr:EF-P lysine aminoacylase EpmA [Imhoffiella purpurea]EXJ15340.1 Translation elongation factor P Lys34:lysine transferase [Imhoffiella purpurea]